MAPGTPLRLTGTCTPWNYCQMDHADIDLAGGAVIVLPDLGTGTSTPRLITFGGKQVPILSRNSASADR